MEDNIKQLENAIEQAMESAKTLAFKEGTVYGICKVLRYTKLSKEKKLQMICELGETTMANAKECYRKYIGD